MADLIGQVIQNTVITGGGASRLQILAQFSAGNQTIIADFELTGAQAQSLAAGLATATVAAAATTGQVTTVTQLPQASPLQGLYNAL